MRRFVIVALAAAALPGLAAAQQQQQEPEATAGQPRASYAAHLAVWAEKCGLDAAVLREAMADEAGFEDAAASYRAEVRDAACTEERRAQTAALLEEFAASPTSGQQ